MTTKNFLTNQNVEFTGKELYYLHSSLSSYLDYLREQDFRATYDEVLKLL